jgi:uncharacterized RDD family membrane protein YckC
MANEQNPYQPPASDQYFDAPSRDSLGQELASRGMRLGAALIDTLLQLAIIAPIQYFAGVYDKFPEVKPLTASETIMWGALGLVLYLALNGWLLATNGQTIGKRVVGTRIVNFTDGARTPFVKLIGLRVLPTYVSLIPVVGPLLSLVDVLLIFRDDQRCIHDHIAGTKVVRA